MKPEEIPEYLEPLLKYAKSLVPDEDKKRTPIFLFATAGMRVLEQSAQDEIIAAVRKTLKKSPFNFTYQEDWARVISGREEGVFGWVTTNYLMDNLMDHDAKSKVVGALDLGGASLQITFLPKEAPVKHEYVLTLPNNDFSLYTYSFLQFGQDLMTKNLMNLSLHKASVGGDLPTDVSFPCYLSGYNETVELENNGTKRKHNMIGAGDYEKCSQYELELMNLTARCEADPCHISGIYQPNVTGDFYAMSGFYYTAHFYKIDNGKNKTSARLFREHAQDFCSRSWANVTKEYDLDKDLLKVYCLTGSYIYNLLTAGFGFDAENTNVYFTSEINGTTLNWALGGLIAEASLLPK